MKVEHYCDGDSPLTKDVILPPVHNGSPSTSSSGRAMRLVVVSCFLASMAYHSFAGTRHRSEISGARDAAASVRGKRELPPSDAAADSVSLLQDEEYDTHAFLGRADGSYSRILSEEEHGTTVEEGHGEEEALGVHITFEDTYFILIFLCVVFICGELAGVLGIPPLVGQIVAGFLVGPPLADIVPYPEAMVLMGDLGLILLLVEAGVELNVGMVKEAGIRPLLIAIAGVVVSSAIGIGTAFAKSQPIKSAIAAGAVFAPTSLGVAANALSGGKALNTPVGQLIVASAVIDDVMGLVVLSMLDVLVAEDPPLISYFIPAISATCYLLVLGISAITWIPYVVEKKILPRFKPDHQQYVAFSLLWILVMAYLPMMYYSKASHLTGAFLAGLAFSQVEGVHHTFVTDAGQIMEWLLRIFFAASIGFQVPIKNFVSLHVVQWGFFFYLAVLGKLPCGLLVQKYDEKPPEDYPFNPYVRDILITSVAMTCRGEFSFIIASFGVANKLLDEALYSAIIFAVLLSAITSPIILTLLLKYYNRKSIEFVEKGLGKVKMTERGGVYVPLHLTIQIRSEIVAGMQSSIKQCCNSLGLFVIDQRSWLPRGIGTIVASELYAIDGKTMVNASKSTSEHEDESQSGDAVVTLRCAEIRAALLNHPDLVDANVKVMQWIPQADAVADAAHKLTKREEIDTLVDEKPKPRRFKVLSGPITFDDAQKASKKAIEREESERGMTPLAPSPVMPLQEESRVTQPVGEVGNELGVGLRRRPRVKTCSTPIVKGFDLWGEDKKAQDAALTGAPVMPVAYDLDVPRHTARRHRAPSDLGIIAENTPTIEERLGGLVRQSNVGGTFSNEF